MLRRRKFIRIISYLVALCVVFAASGVFTARAKSEYESTLEKVRFEALASLTEYSREISSGLRLLAVSAGDSLTDSAAYVSARAVGAMGSLGCFYSEKVDNLTRFFSGVYDFSEEFSGNEESRKTAVKFSDHAQEVYYHLSDLTNAVVSGEYTLTEYDSIYRKSEVPYFEDELDYYGKDEIYGLIPTASAKVSRSVYLDGKDSVSADTAKRTASKLTGINEALWRDGEPKNVEGAEIYALKNGDTEVDICKSGGVIYRIINPQPCGGPIYSLADVRKKAVDFMKNHGFENMTEIRSDENIFTADFVFVPEVNGVLLLPAKIKIGLCLASGKVTYFDASAYICRFRTDTVAVDSIPDVEFMVPEILEYEKSLVCTADIDGAEKLCILAVCRYGNNNVYIFIDCYNMKITKTLMV
ncbi:MAG: germination protein YpeB [Clostridia bacterium]|nr:germination protein YpeB [Clostridia bacterium]